MASVEIPRHVVVGDVKDMLAYFVTWQNAITIAAMATAVNQFMTKSQIDALRSDVNANQVVTNGRIDLLREDVTELKSSFKEMSAKLDAVLNDRRRRWF